MSQNYLVGTAETPGPASAPCPARDVRGTLESVTVETMGTDAVEAECATGRALTGGGCRDYLCLAGSPVAAVAVLCGGAGGFYTGSSGQQAFAVSKP